MLDGILQRLNRPSLTLLPLTLVFLALGCGRPTVSQNKDGASATAAAVDFDVLREGIRQASGDPSSLTPALQRLNDAFAADPARKPVALPPTELAALKEALRLSDPDLAELNRTEFTGL